MITSSAAEIAQRYGVTKATGRVNGSPAYRIPEVCHGSDNGNKDLAIWDGDGGSIGAKCFSRGAPTRPSSTLLASSSRTRDGVPLRQRQRCARHPQARPRQGPYRQPRKQQGSTGEAGRRRRPGENRCAGGRGEGFRRPGRLRLEELHGGALGRRNGRGGRRGLHPAQGPHRDSLARRSQRGDGRRWSKRVSWPTPPGAAALSMVDTSELPDKADAADVDGETIRELLDAAEEWTPPPTVHPSNEAMSKGAFFTRDAEGLEAALLTLRLELRSNARGGRIEVRRQDHGSQEALPSRRR